MTGMSADIRTPVPHLPATCARCLALYSPEERVVARIVLKLIADQPLNGAIFYMPARTPLCELEPVDATQVS